MKVTVIELDAMRLGAIRHVGPYQEIGSAFGKLGTIAAQTGLFGPQTLIVGLYHDDPETTPAEELRSDAAIRVGDDQPLPDSLIEIRIPAGRYACATHGGSYAGLPDAWAELMGRWLPESEHRVGEGTCLEIYRNNPMDTPEDKLITELYVSLA